MLLLSYIIIIGFFTAIFSSSKFTLRHFIASLILLSLLVLCYFYNYEVAILKQTHICDEIRTKCSVFSKMGGLVSIGNETKTCPEFIRDCHLKPWIYNIMDMFMFNNKLNYY